MENKYLQPCEYESDVELAVRTRFWQSLLRLKDWEIKTKLANRLEMAKPGNSAEVSWDYPNKTATIFVAKHNPGEPRNPDFVYDNEVDLVHELVHLHMALLDEQLEDRFAGTIYLARESLVNACANGLVAAYRHGQQ